MAKRGIQENNFAFKKNRIGKFEVHKTCMPIIKCVCGFEILVVPDLKAMNRAIKNHVAKNKKVNECSKLTDFLTERVLIVAATNLSTLN